MSDNNFTLDEAIRVGKSDKRAIQINGFLAHYFRGYEDEIEDILINIILQKQKLEPIVVYSEIVSYLGDD